MQETQKGLCTRQSVNETQHIWLHKQQFIVYETILFFIQTLLRIQRVSKKNGACGNAPF